MHIPIAHNLCRVFEMNPAAFVDQQFVIPESGNGIPDALDEAWFLLLYSQTSGRTAGSRRK